MDAAFVGKGLNTKRYDDGSDDNNRKSKVDDMVLRTDVLGLYTYNSYDSV